MNVFQRYGLMEYGSVYGHGAYLGPDFTAEYLHKSAEFLIEAYAGVLAGGLSARERVAVRAARKYLQPDGRFADLERDQRAARTRSDGGLLPLHVFCETNARRRPGRVDYEFG